MYADICHDLYFVKFITMFSLIVSGVLSWINTNGIYKNPSS